MTARTLVVLLTGLLLSASAAASDPARKSAGQRAATDTPAPRDSKLPEARKDDRSALERQAEESGKASDAAATSLQSGTGGGTADRSGQRKKSGATGQTGQPPATGVPAGDDP